MKITLIVKQDYDIEARTLLQARRALRDGYFPESEIMLAVKDEQGHDITERWQELTKKMRD
jgi:hypothetical protein